MAKCMQGLSAAKHWLSVRFLIFSDVDSPSCAWAQRFYHFITSESPPYRHPTQFRALIPPIVTWACTCGQRTPLTRRWAVFLGFTDGIALPTRGRVKHLHDHNVAGTPRPVL